jgi:hypothetical protein
LSSLRLGPGRYCSPRHNRTPFTLAQHTSGENVLKDTVKQYLSGSTRRSALSPAAFSSATFSPAILQMANANQRQFEYSYSYEDDESAPQGQVSQELPQRCRGWVHRCTEISWRSSESETCVRKVPPGDRRRLRRLLRCRARASPVAGDDKRMFAREPSLGEFSADPASSCSSCWPIG